LFEGLKNLGNLGPVFKQAQEMGAKLQGLKDELRNRHAQASTGAGMVTVEVNGLCEVLSCRIDPSLIKPEDREMLEDLIVAAVNQACAKAKDLHAEAVQSVAGGIPGLGDLIGKMSGS
jgi:DNA-binding YbaB/EbfC family protein